MLFIKLCLQTEVECFSSSSVSLSYQTLFGISIQYVQNCIPNLVTPNIAIDVRIMRPDMLLSCSYNYLQLNSSFNLNCSCDPVDSICKDYQKTLNYNLIGINQNQFIQQELSSFTFEIQIQVTEGENTFSQNINLRTNSKAGLIKEQYQQWQLLNLTQFAVACLQQQYLISYIYCRCKYCEDLFVLIIYIIILKFSILSRNIKMKLFQTYIDQCLNIRYKISIFQSKQSCLFTFHFKMLFMKLILQTEVDCFSSSSVSLSYQTLFGISIQYVQNCIPNLVTPNIAINVQIMRPDLLISCTYDNLQLFSSLELNCQCEPNDSICESFRRQLNQNQYFQQELNSFTVEIKVLVTENDQTFTQNIYFNNINEGNQLFMIFVAVLLIIALILLVFLLVHVYFKCTQKRTKGRNYVVADQTPCPSTVACTMFDSETVKNTIL
ncbi:Hypothetical_protein [Hexamita inflata]|uniref:Hypothetical_protein n=1 Tax=Hexamita inflata TaxID=28002 RepID=A0ABP1HDE6_9EUKA